MKGCNELRGTVGDPDYEDSAIFSRRFGELSDRPWWVLTVNGQQRWWRRRDSTGRRPAQ